MTDPVARKGAPPSSHQMHEAPHWSHWLWMVFGVGLGLIIGSFLP